MLPDLRTIAATEIPADCWKPRSAIYAAFWLQRTARVL